MAPSTTQTLLDRLQINDLFTSEAHAEDTRDWPLLRSLITDPVDFDMSAHLGTAPASLPADDFVNTFKMALSGFDATQHSFANVVATVDESGEKAKGSASVTAYHYLALNEEERREAYGKYGGLVEDYVVVRGNMEVELKKQGGSWLFSAVKIVPIAAPPQGWAGLYQVAGERAKKMAAAEGGE